MHSYTIFFFQQTHNCLVRILTMKVHTWMNKVFFFFFFLWVGDVLLKTILAFVVIFGFKWTVFPARRAEHFQIGSGKQDGFYEILDQSMMRAHEILLYFCSNFLFISINILFLQPSIKGITASIFIMQQVLFVTNKKI